MTAFAVAQPGALGEREFRTIRQLANFSRAAEDGDSAGGGNAAISLSLGDEFSTRFAARSVDAPNSPSATAQRGWRGRGVSKLHIRILFSRHTY